MNKLGRNSFLLEGRITNLKTKLTNLFGKLHYGSLSSLKIHLLDHITKDVERFESLKYFAASPYEHFNYVFKKLIRMTSMRKSVLIAAFVVAKKEVNTEECTNAGNRESRAQGLVRGG